MISNYQHPNIVLCKVFLTQLLVLHTWAIVGLEIGLDVFCSKFYQPGHHKGNKNLYLR